MGECYYNTIFKNEDHKKFFDILKKITKYNRQINHSRRILQKDLWFSRQPKNVSNISRIQVKKEIVKDR